MERGKCADCENNSDSRTSELRETEKDLATVMSNFGAFQYRALIMLCPVFIIEASIVMAFVFLNIIPYHECKQPPWHDQVRLYHELITTKKSYLLYICCTTSKRVTSSGAHLRGLALGQRSSKETSPPWRAVGDTVSDFARVFLNLQPWRAVGDSPGSEPKASRANSDVFNANRGTGIIFQLYSKWN